LALILVDTEVTVANDNVRWVDGWPTHPAPLTDQQAQTPRGRTPSATRTVFAEIWHAPELAAVTWSIMVWMVGPDSACGRCPGPVQKHAAPSMHHGAALA
jgi:hypothetical protein